MKNKITLSDFPKKVPFKVPEGYFEKMEAEILNKVKLSEAPIITLKPKYNWRKWSIGIAASLLIFCGIYFSQLNPNQKIEEEIAKITNQQMIQYLENENIDLADLTENTKINSLELDNIIKDNFDATPLNIDEKQLNQLEIKYLN